MRVLFLHTQQNGLPAEYKVHLTLASHVNKEDLDPYFVWQSPIQTQNYSGVIIPHDFGRDMSIAPKPSRYRRAYLMVRKLPKSIMLLNSLVKEIKPDLIYTSQQSFDVFTADILSRYFHIPHVIHIHYNVGPWLGKNPLKIIQRSSRLIAVSEYIRQTALLQGVSPDSIDTVINPIPISQPQTNHNHQSIRAEFGLENSTPLVVAVGRLDPGKGHLALFEAFSQVIQQIPRARLLICGRSSVPNDYENLLRQRANELQITPFIIFAGQRSDIPAVMYNSDVFCLPTELDPCPLVFIEAMAEGLPVVAYYSGGVPEIVLHNQTGLLSYPGDIQTLATNLVKVLSDKTYAQSLGEAGRHRAAAEFAPSKVTERWFKVLQKKV